MNEAGNEQKTEKNLNKQFRWNGVILSVQSRSLFRKALKLSAAFL